MTKKAFNNDKYKLHLLLAGTTTVTAGILLAADYGRSPDSGLRLYVIAVVAYVTIFYLRSVSKKVAGPLQDLTLLMMAINIFTLTVTGCVLALYLAN